MRFLTRYLVISVVMFCLIPYPGQACTTFSLKHNGQPFFGKNYDWHLERGLVIINKRGASKAALEDRNREQGPYAHWTSRYGSLTFNQYGRELPMGGINEAGLVVELMSLWDTKYPPPDDRPAISECQWIQYQLDHSSKVEHVIASDSRIRIYPSGGTGVHYLVTDKEGNCVTIEFIHGKMVYHTQETLPIKALANSTYTESMAYLKQYKGFGGNQDILYSLYSSQSLDRFVRTANMLRKYDPKAQRSPIDYAFDILANVASPPGWWGTKWSIVYDIQNLRVYFRTFTNKQIRYMDLHSFDFSCQAPVKVLDMNFDASGDMTDHFHDYTRKMNLELIRHSFKGTDFLSNIPDGVLEELSNYPESTCCD